MAKIKKMRRLKRLAYATTGLAGAVLLASSSTSFAATGMPTGNRTTQPIGHYEFCKNAPQECQKTGASAPHALSRADWQTMVDINNRINSEIRPLTDMEIWGRNELWSYPETVGDCEDFVLLKRHMLIQAGFEPSNLLITVVKQVNGDGHAVLTVRTDRGDFILDNLVSRINEWRNTNYTYLKRQSTEHAGRWVDILDGSYTSATR